MSIFCRSPRPFSRSALCAAILAWAGLATNALAQCGPAVDPASLGAVPSELARVIGDIQKSRSSFCSPGPGIIDPGSDPGGAAPQNQANPGPRRPNEVVARVNGDEQVVRAVARALNLQVVETRPLEIFNAQTARYRIPDARSIDAVIAQLNADARVVAADANHLYRLQQSNFDDARFAPKLIHLSVSRSIGLSGTGIRIGIIDTAVDANSDPLKGRIASTFNALPKVPLNSSRHGTLVASLILGGSGFSGVAGRAEIYAARAFDLDASGEGVTDYYAIEGSVRWAASVGVRVLNMSFAGPRNRLLSDTLEKVAARGMFLVASVGNEGPQAPPAFPAAFNWVVGVTALDEQKQVYAKANRGKHVFVAAPGVNVLAAGPGGIDIVNGTSFATPFISGIAALIIEGTPAATPRQIAVRMRNGTIDLGKRGRDPIFGYGLVDLEQLFR